MNPIGDAKSRTTLWGWSWIEDGSAVLDPSYGRFRLGQGRKAGPNNPIGPTHGLHGRLGQARSRMDPGWFDGSAALDPSYVWFNGRLGQGQQAGPNNHLVERRVRWV
ncbi:MAG: hypothetical protein Kow006_04660 [Gammaproteobacteria bacterium]